MKMPASKLIHATVLCVLFFVSGCKLFPEAQDKNTVDEEVAIVTEERYEEPDPIAFKPYKLAAPIVWKQQHIKVRMAFDVAEQKALATCTLTLSPHHSSKKIRINAVGFYPQKEVQLLAKDSTLRIEKVKYDSLEFHITLNKACSPTDTIQLLFDYEVQPADLLSRELISRYDQQGLFFINPEGTEKDVPTQIWSQGETQYNSSWIPCMDYPNQKTSQEFYLTVDTPYVGLSNGRLVYMLLNEDGTRTFYWKQEKKHAPYLIMIAVGDFGIVEDETSSGLPLYYYVEPEYVPYAHLIFGKTPKMIEFFSKKFGYDYPWDKYAQVAVRDFVAGAMENTSATTITHRIQKDSIGHNDNNYEDYIAHELGHQWFGDLVTSESWANLTLNEAFATYSEYLWFEESLGKDKANEVLLEMKASYLRQARYAVHPLIHYSHNENDDMFDRHSYQKGALALHTLRLHLGDGFFFDGIKTYLHQNAYKAVDIDHLRHAFEEASGQDLRPFFDQWFLYANHPILNAKYEYVDSTQKITFRISQEQAENGYGLYDLNLPITIKTASGIVRDTFRSNLSDATMELELKEKPIYCYIDADQYPLAELNLVQDEKAWTQMLVSNQPKEQFNASLNLIEQWAMLSEPSKTSYLNYAYSLDRSNSFLDALTIGALRADSIDHDLKPFLKSPDYSILARALRDMSQRSMGNRQLYTDFLKMPSHYVKAASVSGLCNYYDKDIENQLLKESNTRSTYLQYMIAQCWAENGTEKVNSTFQDIVNSYSRTASSYGSYLGRQSTTFATQQLAFLRQLYVDEVISENQLRATYSAILSSSEQHQNVENQLYFSTLIDKEMGKIAE